MSCTNFGIIKNEPIFDPSKLERFTASINQMKEDKQWNKQDLVELFNTMIPNFGHKETGTKKFECQATIRNGKMVYDLNGITTPILLLAK